MSKKSKLDVSVEVIQDKIYLIRGHKVMLDQDLAELYGVLTLRLNEQVKRNISRFPEDFMFQLTLEEYQSLRSQIAISSLDRPHGGRRFRPYAFTEPIPQPVRATPATETKRPKEVEEELEIV